jgi:hypothetical protein
VPPGARHPSSLRIVSIGSGKCSIVSNNTGTH